MLGRIADVPTTSSCCQWVILWIGQLSEKNLGNEIFTDLDFADDVALPTEMLEVLVLTLEIVNGEASRLGLEINWEKTKIQTTDAARNRPSKVTVAGNEVEVVKAFTYLGSFRDNTGRSEPEMMGRIGIARESFASVSRNMWSTSIRLDTKVRLQKVFILPVPLYDSETWTLTATMERKLDTFHQWCLRGILRIIYTYHIRLMRMFIGGQERVAFH